MSPSKLSDLLGNNKKLALIVQKILTKKQKPMTKSSFLDNRNQLVDKIEDTFDELEKAAAKDRSLLKVIEKNPENIFLRTLIVFLHDKKFFKKSGNINLTTWQSVSYLKNFFKYFAASAVGFSVCLALLLKTKKTSILVKSQDAEAYCNIIIPKKQKRSVKKTKIGLKDIKSKDATKSGIRKIKKLLVALKIAEKLAKNN